jgi:mannose PTS system EIID component
MSLIQSLIMATLAMLSKCGMPMWSRWSLGMGAPLIAGFLNGIIMGDIAYGLQMGASIMLVYVGVAVIGGAISSDPMLGGWLGVTASMMAHAEPELGITVASTLGIIGSLLSPLERTINSAWVARAHAYAEKGDTKGVMRLATLAPMLVAFVLYWIPGFILLYFGAPVLEGILANFPQQVTSAFSTVGKLLPALGLAMLINLLYKNSLIPFLIFGFVATAYLGLSVMPVAFIGAGLAILHYIYTRKETE